MGVTIDYKVGIGQLLQAAVFAVSGVVAVVEIRARGNSTAEAVDQLKERFTREIGELRTEVVNLRTAGGNVALIEQRLTAAEQRLNTQDTRSTVQDQRVAAQGEILTAVRTRLELLSSPVMNPTGRRQSP